MRYYADRAVPHTRHYAFLPILLYGILRIEVRRILVIMRFQQDLLNRVERRNSASWKPLQLQFK